MTLDHRVPTEMQPLSGGVSDQALQGWNDGETTSPPDDLLSRLGELLDIHKALRSLFPDVVRDRDGTDQ